MATAPKNQHLGVSIIVLVAVIFVGGWIASNLFGSDWRVELKKDMLNELAQRFASFAGIALVVERSVEAYLKVSGQDTGAVKVLGPDVGTGDKILTRENTVPAVTAALIIGLVLGVLGVRILDVFVMVPPNSAGFGQLLYTGVDVTLSAGLLAGGAVVFHPLLKSITELFTGFQEAAQGRRLDRQTQALQQEIGRRVALNQLAQLPSQGISNITQP